MTSSCDSVWPWNRPVAFHSVRPCRSSRTRRIWVMTRVTASSPPERAHLPAAATTGSPSRAARGSRTSAPRCAARGRRCRGSRAGPSDPPRSPSRRTGFASIASSRSSTPSTTARTCRSFGAEASTKQSVMASCSLTSMIARSVASLSAAALTAASASSTLRVRQSHVMARLRSRSRAQDHDELRDTLVEHAAAHVDARKAQRLRERVGPVRRRCRWKISTCRARVGELRRVAAADVSEASCLPAADRPCATSPGVPTPLSRYTVACCVIGVVRQRVRQVASTSCLIPDGVRSGRYDGRSPPASIVDDRKVGRQDTGLLSGRTSQSGRAASRALTHRASTARSCRADAPAPRHPSWSSAAPESVASTTACNRASTPAAPSP